MCIIIHIWLTMSCSTYLESKHNTEYYYADFCFSMLGLCNSIVRYSYICTSNMGRNVHFGWLIPGQCIHTIYGWCIQGEVNLLLYGRQCTNAGVMFNVEVVGSAFMCFFIYRLLCKVWHRYFLYNLVSSYRIVFVCISTMMSYFFLRLTLTVNVYPSFCKSGNLVVETL